MRGSGDKAAYFTWHGAPMPQFDPNHALEAAARGYADEAAPRLASFTNSLSLNRWTDIVPIGHSYGAVVLAQAEGLGLRADRVMYVAPAGLGESASGVAAFPQTGDVHHFSLQARNDVVVGLIQGKISGLGLGHGLADPLDGRDITRLETGYLDDDSPEEGTVETKNGVESHTAVFTPGSTAMKNITGVVTGDPVSLYHPDDIVDYGPEAPPMQVQGTGVEKPEELISPLTLGEVG